MSATAATPAAGIDAVEIKVTVRPDQELRAERALQVNEETADVRMIYFFDTPDLDLFEAGVVLRARQVKGDDDDSTVKLRPVDPATMLAYWREREGFKMESDWTGDRSVCSASLTAIQQSREIDEVADGERTIDKLFSSEQEGFLQTFAKVPVAFDKLVVMGPIRVLRWKLIHEDFEHQLTVEEWRLPNGDDLVEVSIKVEPDHAPAAQQEFNDHLVKLGLDPQGAQETKTRTALSYFAGVAQANAEAHQRQ